MLSIVVPVFNEEESLRELHSRLTAAIPLDERCEIVLVDDGSRDASWPIMRDLAAGDPRLRLIRLSRNFGHQAAITAGLAASRGEAVIVIDADLQDPPELIADLVARWHEGFDVVYAVRAKRTGESRFKLATSSLFYKLLRRISDADITENAGDFRLMSRRVVTALGEMPERSRFLRGMTSWVGYRQTGVEYEREVRFAGESKYSTRKMARLALDGITSFSTVPVRLVAWLGFALVAFCMVVLGWTLYTRFFTTEATPGWTSLLVVVLLLGGVQLLSLGIIGEYVARIFEETKRRPLYFIADVVETLEPTLDEAGPAASRQL